LGHGLDVLCGQSLSLNSGLVHSRLPSGFSPKWYRITGCCVAAYICAMVGRPISNNSNQMNRLARGKWDRLNTINRFFQFGRCAVRASCALTLVGPTHLRAVEGVEQQILETVGTKKLGTDDYDYRRVK
jgi:hypothetical protein